MHIGKQIEYNLNNLSCGDFGDQLVWPKTKVVLNIA